MLLSLLHWFVLFLLVVTTDTAVAAAAAAPVIQTGITLSRAASSYGAQTAHATKTSGRKGLGF